MKFFDIKTPFKGNGTFILKIKDRTHTILKNGRKIPTALNMIRQASKI